MEIVLTDFENFLTEIRTEIDCILTCQLNDRSESRSVVWQPKKRSNEFIGF